jgi:cellulose synthase/poly-beta-1,6-N-acetylglucosamine synthase-like glycosyltransferase
MGMIIWSILLGLVVLIWVTRHLEINRAKREQIPLTANSYDGPPKNGPFVSVLIAAKDEEDNIETAVRTMLQQDYPSFEVIAINDRSNDRTGDILESLKAEQSDGQLKVIHVDELREGWFGKNNAMRVGLKHARGEWFCFGDADCRQTSNKTLSVAVRHAVERKLDFFSVLPFLETHSIWERIIQPVCGAVMMFWFHPKKVNDPENAAAYANGAFMMLHRDCYEGIGGHEAVRTEVNEDMHMARRAKEQGYRLEVIPSENLYHVRMYSRLGDIWRGWSRIFYGCFGSFRRLRLSMMTLIVTNIFPYLSALIALIVVASRGWSAAGAGWQWVAGLSLLCIFLQQTVIMRFYRFTQINPLLAPTFIVGVVICIGMLANAMLKLNGGTTTWRGTTYQGQKVANPDT